MTSFLPVWLSLIHIFLIGTLALTLTFPPLPAQKIETETPSRERVVRVQTAMNHLTVIEVAEPVTTVAVGSPQAFKAVSYTHLSRRRLPMPPPQMWRQRL